MAIEKTTTQNGVRTFHTAGKYCDQDIVVTTSVPSSAPVTETKTVALDMASGDLVVSKSANVDGMTQVTITKPATFLASNIKSGVTIGGVTGTYAPTLITKSITQNGVYYAPSDGVDGYVEVNVNVSGGGGGGDATEIINRSISSITSNVQTVGEYAFAFCRQLNTVDLPNCDTVSGSAFFGCYNITSISIPNLKYIVGTSAFAVCNKVQSFDFPELLTIGSYAFSSCRSASYFGRASKCISIYDSAFWGCEYLKSITFDLAEHIGSGAFISCYRLSYAYIPNCKSVYNNAFLKCYDLASINLLKCNQLYNGAFASCSSLSTVYLENCTNIAQQAFSRCVTLTSLYLLGSSITTLGNANAFTSTPISNYTTETGGINGSIFVRQSLVASYQTTTNWITYSSRFVGLTDAEIEVIKGQI